MSKSNKTDSGIRGCSEKNRWMKPLGKKKEKKRKQGEKKSKNISFQAPEKHLDNSANRDAILVPMFLNIINVYCNCEHDMVPQDARVLESDDEGARDENGFLILRRKGVNENDRH